MQGTVGNIEHVSIVNGELRMPNYLTEMEEGRFIGNAASISEAKKMIDTTLKRRGFDDKTIAKAQADFTKNGVERIENPTFTANMHIDKHEFDLPFIKIAYEYAHAKLGDSYQKDCLCKLLKGLIHSFVVGKGDDQLLQNFQTVNVFQIVDTHLKKHELDDAHYLEYLAKYLNKCCEFKGLPAHALRLKEDNGVVYADIMLFCHPLFHYSVVISLNANSYHFTEDVDYIICSCNYINEKGDEEIKKVLIDNEQLLFAFPPIDEV